MVKEEIQANINFVKLEKREGVFVNENGTEIPFKNYYIHFTIDDNPLIFKAKIDKVLNDYVEENDDENRSF